MEGATFHDSFTRSVVVGGKRIVVERFCVGAAFHLVEVANPVGVVVQARAIAVIARNDIDTSAVVQGGGVVVAGVFVQASHAREIFAAPVVGVGLRVVVARRQGGAAREHTRPVDGGVRIVVVRTFFSATHAAREVAEGRDGGFWIVVARALQDASSAGVEVATSVVEVRQRVVVAGLGVCTIEHQAAEVFTRTVVRVGFFLVVARVFVCATQDHIFVANHLAFVLPV